MTPTYTEYSLATSATPSTATPITADITAGHRVFVFTSAANTVAVTLGSTSDAALYAVGPNSYFEIPGFVKGSTWADISGWYCKSAAANQSFRVLILNSRRYLCVT